MDPAKVAFGLSLCVLASGCHPARGTGEAAAPSVEENPIPVGRLPSIAAPSPGIETPMPMAGQQAEGGCSNEEKERREFVPVECSPTCTGHEVLTRYCANGRWNWKTLEANCALCPTSLPQALAACSIDRTSIKPSELSSSDGCKLEISCGNDKLLTECDGENDGTNTSLCDCKINGKEAHHVSNPVPGEAPDACFRAAEKCLNRRRR